MSDSATVEATPIDAIAPDPEDPRDLAAARSGDHAGFARIYDRHAAVVLSICRRFAGTGMHDHAEAEDALQETFIRAYRLLDTLDDPRRLRSWLFSIARRVCAERRRGAARRHRHEEAAMTTLSHPAVPPSTAHAASERQEALQRLGAALESLPDEERLAIHLYYLDPDPVRAAQECLRVSRSGFYKLLARARTRLARLMEGPTS